MPKTNTHFGLKVATGNPSRNRYNLCMYIVAIAWLYVTILMAATETTLVAGLLTFLFYGLSPLALFLWLFGTPRRRHRQRLAESAASDEPVATQDKATEELKP